MIAETTKFIDRRHNADTRQQEDDRLERREAKKLEIARAELASRRLAELQDAQRQVNAKLDSIAVEHSERMGPLQAELAEINNTIIRSIAQRQPVSETTEHRRKEILAEIDDANRTLEASLAEERSLLPHLQSEMAKVSRQAAEYAPLTNDLASEALARPDWYDEYDATRAVVSGVSELVKHLRKATADCEDNLRSARDRQERSGQDGLYAQDIRFAENRLRRWQLAVSRAQSIQAELSSELDSLRQRMLDE